MSNVTLTGQGANPAVTVAPDVGATGNAPSAPVPGYPVDPSTGFPVDVIKTGEFPGSSLGDTAPPPAALGSVNVPSQDLYGPTFGKKDAGAGEVESAIEDKGETGE